VDLDVDYATTLIAAVLLGIGFVLQQYAARQEPECLFLSPRIIIDLLHKPDGPPASSAEQELATQRR